jgi:hypothetical protein
MSQVNKPLATLTKAGRQSVVRFWPVAVRQHESLAGRYRC